MDLTPPESHGDWKFGLCEDISFEESEIPRNQGNSNYFKLSFSYRFREQDLGNDVVFAYAVPYGYTDLLQDLEETKTSILKTWGDSVNIAYLKSDKLLNLNPMEASPIGEMDTPKGKKQGLLPRIGN
jgi:hypothetical protein